MSDHDAPVNAANPSVGRVAFSFGKDKFDAYPEQHAVPDFTALAEFVCERRAAERGKLYFAAPFSGHGDGKHHRCKDDAMPRTWLPLDLDYVRDREAMAELLLAAQRWQHFAYETASSTVAKPRMRAVFSLSRAVSRDEGIRCGLAFQREWLAAASLPDEAVKFDESVYRGEQPCFGPLTQAEIYPRDRQITGAVLNVEHLLAKAPELASSSTSVDRAGGIIDTDPRVQHLIDSGYVLKVKTAAGKLAIRCPNESAHSGATSPTATIVLLPHFNGVPTAVIKCLHASCAGLTQADFWRLAGYIEVDAESSMQLAHSTEGVGASLPRYVTALELMERDVPPIAYLCNPWLPEGLKIVAGRPKLSKTTLLRQELAAVAGGDAFFVVSCTQATAIFLSLEEGDRLTRKKLEMVGFSDRALASILIYFAWRRGKNGVFDLLRTLDANPSVRFVGIDSLTRFRDVPDTRTPAFVCDYEAVSALHAVVKDRPGLCIDVVHHTRKAKSDDAIEDISGTFGISAACDSFWVMRHHEDGAVLHVGGRLWENDTTQFQLRRAEQRWELVGEFTGARTTQVQAQTLDALRTAQGMTPSQVAATFGIVPSSAYQRLTALVREGLARNENGRYFARL